MNAHDAVPLHALLDEFEDVGEITWVDDDGNPHVLGPAHFLWKVLAKGKVQAWAQVPETGASFPIPAEVFMGATSFVYDIGLSVLVWAGGEPPFGEPGGQLPRARIVAARADWCARHERDDDSAELVAWLEGVCGLDLERGRERVYFVVVDDPAAARATMMDEIRSLFGDGDEDVAPSEDGASRSDKEFLTSKEVADMLGIGEQSLRRWRTQGKGPPFVKIEGARVLYPRRDLEDWLRTARPSRAELSPAPTLRAE